MSLHEILIPLIVKVIKSQAFIRCSWLTLVNLGEGLEKIGAEAFRECTSLREIVIPPTLKAIKYRAFYWCLQLGIGSQGVGGDWDGSIS